MSASIASDRQFERSAARRSSATLSLLERLRLQVWVTAARPSKLLLMGLAIIIVALFRLTLLDGWTFVGDSDRLNTVLNARLFEVNQIQSRGSISMWTDQQFMGQSMAGLHWILVGF